MWETHSRQTARIGRRLVALGVVAGMTACTVLAEIPVDTPSRTIPAEEFCDADREEEQPAWLNVADHIFVVDQEGRFVDAAVNGTLPEGRDFAIQMRKVLEASAQFRQRPEAAEQTNRILIFINGGLNSLETSVKRAKTQVPCMMRAGYFPIFLIWHSGFLDTYWEQISQIRSGHLYSSPRATTPIYFLADLGQGIVRAPATYLSQIGRFLDTFEMSYEDLGGAEKNSPIGPTGDLLVRYDGPAQNFDRFALNTLHFAVTAPIKLASTPIVDALGSTAWENMVRRTRTTLRKPSEFDQKLQNKEELKRYPKGTGGFSKFFTELEICMRGQADCLAPGSVAHVQQSQITLIGHSMGAIILNDLMRLYDELPYRNVVYMGAACSIRNFLNTVVPVMESHPEMRFYNLSLHPVADGRETTGYGLTPSGSLLEWVDDMYESPPTMLDRTLGKWLNVAQAAHVFPEHLRDRMLFRVFGFREANEATNDPGDPTTHGDFNDTEMHYWLPDFWGKPEDWPY